MTVLLLSRLPFIPPRPLLSRSGLRFNRSQPCTISEFHPTALHSLSPPLHHLPLIHRQSFGKRGAVMVDVRGDGASEVGDGVDGVVEALAATCGYAK